MRKHVYVLALLLVGVALFTASYRESERQQQASYEMASAESQPALCTDAVTKEKVRTILLEALDDALKQQVMHTFEVWMKDDRDQPARARTGVLNAIRAYLGARKGAMQFEIMECPG